MRFSSRPITRLSRSRTAFAPDGIPLARQPGGLRFKTARVAFVILLLATLTHVEVAGQQTACSYDECALRLKTGFLSQRLVQGRDEQKVAGFVFLAPPLTELMQRSDSAVRYYSQFRTRHNRGFWFSLAGLTMIVGAEVLYYAVDRDQESLAIGMVIGGVGSYVVGLINAVRSTEPLSKAVWWYNRSLVVREP